MTNLVIHSSIADNGNWGTKNAKGQTQHHNAVLLWYYVRGVDTQGSGVAVVDLQEVAKMVKKSESSIRRWWKWGLELGLFRAVFKVKPHIYRIFYSSLTNVCLRHGLQSLGACGRVGLEVLGNLKFIATELEVKKLQGQSLFQEKHKKHADRNKWVPSAEELLRSELGSGPIAGKSGDGRFTYLKRSAFAHGGSQASVAHRMNRHISTVQRRLSDGYREQHSLPPIDKTQLLTAPKYLPPVRGVSRLVPNQLLMIGPGKQFYTVCPNVYFIDHEVLPLKNRRRELNKAINLLEEDYKAHPLYRQLMSSWKQEELQTINSPYVGESKFLNAPEPSFPHISIGFNYESENLLKIDGALSPGFEQSSSIWA